MDWRRRRRRHHHHSDGHIFSAQAQPDAEGEEIGEINITLSFPAPVAPALRTVEMHIPAADVGRLVVGGEQGVGRALEEYFHANLGMKVRLVDGGAGGGGGGEEERSGDKGEAGPGPGVELVRLVCTTSAGGGGGGGGGNGGQGFMLAGGMKESGRVRFVGGDDDDDDAQQDEGREEEEEEEVNREEEEGGGGGGRAEKSWNQELLLMLIERASVGRWEV